jgi:hypothetical protein
MQSSDIKAHIRISASIKTQANASQRTIWAETNAAPRRCSKIEITG